MGKGEKINLAIVYANNLKEAQKLEEILKKNPNINLLFISSISPVLGIHAGPGTLGVAFYPVELD